MSPNGDNALSEVFDVVVVGQGLVGASFVLALNHLSARPAKKLRVLHIDAQVQAQALGAHANDERHLALNAYSVEQLMRIGVELPLAQCSAIKRVHISRVGDFGRVLLDASEEGVAHFGHLIPASVLRSSLDAALARVADVALHRHFDTKLHAMHLTSSGYALELTTPEGRLKVDAGFVVGADGTNSAVRGLMSRFDDARAVDNSFTYDQAAVSFNLSAERDHAGCAFERFTDHGPIAVLPLPNKRVGVIWTLPTDEAKMVIHLSETEFLARFQSAFGYRLGRFEASGKRTLWPLQRMRAQPDVALHCVLIGNAAQTIHPLGAQGFNLGLRDALALAELTGRGHFEKEDLMQFSLERSRDRADTLGFSDGGLVATQNRSTAAKLARQFAWSALETWPLAKRSLTRFGLGYSRASTR
jgi:2-octaprenyl-6-methoxyphenol hydroxylase